MPLTPPSLHRSSKNLQKKLQEGTLLSFTTITHPPAGFPGGKRSIGLIELSDRSKVLGALTGNTDNLEIGMQVLPQLRLSQVSSTGLRSYDVSYEVATRKPVHTKEPVFPGYILALTGPSGVGKSTVSRLLSRSLRQCSAPVTIITTKEPKASDKGEYTYVTVEEFQRLQECGELATGTEIPSSTESRFYGYKKADIEAIWDQGKLPIVITEMNLLEGLSEHYGRRSILSCGLLPPGSSRRTRLSSLLHRLRSRGREDEAAIRDRMQNAEKDLDFFEQKRYLFDHLVINDDIEVVVKTLSGHVMELQKA